MAIFGPKGLESLIYNLYHRVFSKTNLSNVLNFLPRLSELPFPCSTSIGVHSPPDTIYRLELDGTTVVYTGDTAQVDLTKIARNADYLIDEASETKPALARCFRHSTRAQAARAAKRAGAKNLVLVHSPRLTPDRSAKSPASFPERPFPLTVKS